MNIHEKISAVMQDVNSISKDGGVKYGNTNYKYLSAEKTIKIMREELIKHKLVVYPIKQESERTGNITHLDITYRLVNVENPEEYIDIVSCGDGMDTADKASGKAMTYAYKYLFWRTFCVPVGDDPDCISSEQLVEEAEAEARKKEPISQQQGQTLMGILKNKDSARFMQDYGIARLGELTVEQYVKAAKELDSGKYDK